MPKPSRLSDSIRQQTGMNMRQLADIFQVSASALTLSLQGKRPRPAGLSEALAIPCPSAQVAILGKPLPDDTDAPALLKQEATRTLRRLGIQAKALELEYENAHLNLSLLHTRCAWLPLLLQQPSIQADETKQLAVQLALRKARQQGNKLKLQLVALTARIKSVEAMQAVWANL
jgi:transcriptional regulator with XRE-family HTH domain